MQAGEMNRRISILEFSKIEHGYEWVTVKNTWAKVQRKSLKNLFSQIGIGADTAIFTVHRQPLTLHQAILWNGEHYFLTDIADVESSKMYYEVTAARVYPVPCAVTHFKTVLNELKNPVAQEKETVVFPAILTEKYAGFEQKEPQAVTKITYVLVVPKAIILPISDVVEIQRKKYCVQVAHILDEYKNEYEVTYEGDA